MGTRYVLHFDNDVFMKSVNEAKWNIYAVSLQDLTFYTFSYLKTNLNFKDLNKSKEIFHNILDDESTNNMPSAIIDKTKKKFEERFQSINWNEYWNNIPFNQSALSLYEWAPIAEELKTLDRKIILNSVILKWDIIKKEYQERIQF
jgi:ankyrin repeat protein